ncbi:MAG: hypothetical protein IID03_08790 [Candidatus Dadabacteria bacterium]|nr:hypothetical protein [Candidatus Dadabacteria bacterium]
MDNASLNTILHSGQRARLIPVVKDSKKEERSTSALLATFRVVPSYAEKVLSNVGVSITTRSKISCYTEISFKSKDKKYPRPDGLIIVTTGSKNWSAIVESKIDNNDLNQEQIEQYIDIAKENGIDALITISNQLLQCPHIILFKFKRINCGISRFTIFHGCFCSQQRFCYMKIKVLLILTKLLY